MNHMQRYLALQKIVETGSFTKAAQALGYTQPALSQMVASLEKELGFRLLQRSRNGVRLTPEGERLYPFIARTTAQYTSMEEIVKDIKGLDTGVIRLGTISSISAHWLPQMISTFWKQYPNVQFVIHQGDYTTIPEWIRTGEADLGFVCPYAVPGMKPLFVKTGSHMAVLPEDHPLAKQKSITLKDLAKEPFLLLEEGSYSEVLDAFEKKGLKPDIRLRMHDDYSILSMVEQGLGVSILPSLVLRKTAYDVGLIPLKPDLKRRIGLFTRNDAELSIAARTFAMFLEEHAQELP